MSAKKKPTKVHKEIVFSVKKFRYLFYNGTRINYPRTLKLLGIKGNQEFTDYLRERGKLAMPSGFMGGPVNKRSLENCVEFFPQLKQSLFEIKIRFRVMRDDVATHDQGYDYQQGIYRQSGDGFLTRRAAFIAAEKQFNELRSFVSDSNTHRLRLLLQDADGNVIKDLTNARTGLRSGKKREA